MLHFCGPCCHCLPAALLEGENNVVHTPLTTANSAKSLLTERLRSSTTLTPRTVQCAARRATRAITSRRKTTSKQVQPALKTQRASVLLSTTHNWLQCEKIYCRYICAFWSHYNLCWPSKLSKLFFKPNLNCLNRCEEKILNKDIIILVPRGRPSTSIYPKITLKIFSCSKTFERWKEHL